MPDQKRSPAQQVQGKGRRREAGARQDARAEGAWVDDRNPEALYDAFADADDPGAADDTVAALPRWAIRGAMEQTLDRMNIRERVTRIRRRESRSGVPRGSRGFVPARIGRNCRSLDGLRTR